MERGFLGVSALLLFAASAIGFRWVASPYLRGYAFAGGGCYLLSRLAASLQPSREAEREAT